MTASIADHVPAQPFNLVSVDNTPNRLLRFVHLESHALFWLCFFVTCILLLAHLTNPTEASFRTFLTELAFRRHLTKLNGSITDQPNDTGSGAARRGGGSTSDPPPSAPPTIGPVFHFSKSATVMLRTPVNITRSFVFFTIVIVTPVSDLTASSKDRNTPVSTVLEGTWYIGALGHWWTGGAVDLPRFRRHGRKEVLGKEEGIGLDLKAGILDFLSLDRPALPESSATNASQPTKHADAKNSKVKRRRSLPRQSAPMAPRSNTPPPLPESASLPLHSARMPPGSTPLQVSAVDRPSSRRPPPGTAACGAQADLFPPCHSPSPSDLESLDQNPLITDILEQLKASESAIADLQSQTSNHTVSSSAQHHALQSTLQTHREKKQLDDQTRNEQKTKMKGYEDSKRTAEMAKREAEKRLKTVQSKHDATLNRIERLSDEIQGMQKAITNDESKVVKSCMDANESEAELVKVMESKKKELKIAGDVVAALSQRAKEYEGKVKAQQEKLARVKEMAEERHRKRMSSLQHQQQQSQRPHHSQSSVQSRNSSQISPVGSIGQGQQFGNLRGQPRTDSYHQQHFLSPAGLNFAPAINFASASMQPGLLQRRNIQDPERLMLQNGSNDPRQMELRRTPSFGRQRAISLSGNGGVTVETTGTNGYTALTSRFSGRRISPGHDASPASGGRGLFNHPTGSSTSIDRPSSVASLARRNSYHSQRGTRTFAPFAETDGLESDASSTAAYPTSLLPSSLVKSLDAESVRSPSLDVDETDSYLDYDRYDGSYGQSSESIHPDSFEHGTTEWSSPVSNGHVEAMYNDYQFSPSTSYAGSLGQVCNSPDSGLSPHGFNGVPSRARSVKFANGTMYHNRIYGSSQSSFERYISASTPLDTVHENRDAKHRRWFPSFINSHSGHAVFPQNDQPSPVPKPSKVKSGLNPDAKSFSLARGRSFLLNEAKNAPHSVYEQAEPPEFTESMNPETEGIETGRASNALASRMDGSPMQPSDRPHTAPEQLHTSLNAERPPSTPTGNFFSSLLAFAPSPAERQALQRGLENASAAVGNKKPVAAKFPFMKGGSQDSLPVLGPAWSLPEADASSTEDLSTPEVPAPATTKRSISSLWLRSKPAPTKVPIQEESTEVNIATAPPKEELPGPALGFGSRFARFARHSQKGAADNNASLAATNGAVNVMSNDDD